MKKRGKKSSRPAPGEKLVIDFARGFVATGLLSALQDRCAPGAAIDGRRALRHALQGGVALAAGSAAAEALARRDVFTVLLAVAGGGAAIASIEQLLHRRVQPTLLEN